MNLTRKERQILLLGLADDRLKDPKVFARYFRTDHWGDVKERKLAIHKTCQLCRHRPATQVHHKTYATLFKENIHRDLDSVCARCHKGFSKG